MFTAFIPLILKLANWLMDKSGASKETREQMLLVIKSAQNDAAISKTNKDELKAQKEKLKAEMLKEKQNGA